MSGEDRNTKLMRQMGSKTGKWNPDAPDQNLFWLNHAKEAINKGAAWIKSNTTERIPGSPDCVDKDGNLLHVEDMAKDCGWKPQTGKNVLSEMIAAGLVKLGSDRRISQCADIPLAHQKPKKKLKNGGEEKENPYFVQSIWSGQVLDSIEHLPKEQFVWIEARSKEYLEWRPTLFSDGMAALRAIDERMKDTILGGVGLEKKAPPKKGKNARKESPAQLKLELLVQPYFVQSMADGPPVQSTEPTLYTGQNGAASFMYSDSLLQTTTTDAPPPSSEPVPDVVVVGKKLKSYGAISKHAQQKFLDSCRKESPGCTVEQISAVIDQIASKFNRHTDSPIGVLISQVPGCIAEYCATEVAPENLPACAVCHEPLEGGSIQGAHFDCYERAKGAGA